MLVRHFILDYIEKHNEDAFLLFFIYNFVYENGKKNEKDFYRSFARQITSKLGGLDSRYARIVNSSILNGYNNFEVSSCYDFLVDETREAEKYRMIIAVMYMFLYASKAKIVGQKITFFYSGGAKIGIYFENEETDQKEFREYDFVYPTLSQFDHIFDDRIPQSLEEQMFFVFDLN